MSHWININDGLPENGKHVIAIYKNSHGRRRTIIGIYIQRWHVESSGDEENNDEYSEEKDTYFLREGWYEAIDNWGDFSSICVHEGAVTHWMPLPISPEGFEDEALTKGDGR